MSLPSPDCRLADPKFHARPKPQGLADAITLRAQAATTFRLRQLHRIYPNAAVWSHITPPLHTGNAMKFNPNRVAPESSVLTPLDPSKDTNSDDWPDFELKDAEVYLPKGWARKTSLLTASEHHPLLIVGDVQLHSIPKALAHTIKQQRHSHTALIDIRPVKSFAYGQFEDGTIALWAGGRAGWFRFQPTRAYRETYDEMIEAIKMLYFVADAYREERKYGKGRKAVVLPPYEASEIFGKYAQEVLGIPTAVDEAATKVYEHVDFLFASMLAGKEGIDWMQNPLYLHLLEKRPLEHATVVRRVAGTLQKPDARHSSIESGSTSTSLKRKRGRQPPTRDHESVSVAHSSTPGSTAGVAQKPAAAKASKVSDVLQPKPLVPPCRRIRRKTSPASDSVPEEPEAAEAAETAETPIPERSDSEDAHPSRAGKSKSALRLKPSRGAKGKKSETSRGGKAPALDEDNAHSEDEPTSSPTAAKRAIPDSPAFTRPSRRRSSKPIVDEGIDMPDSPPASDASSPDAVLGASATADDHEPLATADATSVCHAPDPVQEDTWRCALDGCTHKVYLASQPLSQRLIREHYALHAYDDDERVRLVRKLEAPSLPVERLMEKVRLQARVEGVPGSLATFSRFPDAVRRRY
ncbi:hypothetical protein LTR91_010194 [Friedmanniomyces endolithicus]|uniref:DNA (cytosine-5)-methyltransferase 1 replication foci domain-containing protein n=1 Tax=Friedmanniomyces endolithicus TaxID=329885 RepID=A0AAN6QTQ6_9PEZI|nr:hypothetical protein LTR57_003236 [Friedmanniomyces endolithicus]KAK0986479.1 hypothetical protein LTR91_010194 [Friedmanniomyces endolithicus]KAK1008008.1 hypothetical protein LTS01_002506 [Friedmanniomyces endolithicus]KAK1035896.1 hypothetical protein LTS16_014162 [Friedmanniomyces endolithicus]